VKLRSSSAEYEVGLQVAETAAYRMYLCEEVASGRQCLLQIATSVEHSGGLDKAAYILKKLRVTADEFERIHAEQGGKRLLSYERLFPELVDSFVPEEQGRRRVNILAFSEVSDIRLMVPLSNLTSKDHLRLDLRSSAWVLGRLLKLLGFTHGEGISVNLLGGGNVLLEPSQHFAVVFDWSSALTHQDQHVPRKYRVDDVANAAKTVFVALGGDPQTADYPYLSSADVNDRRYISLVTTMMQHREGNAERAHQQLYSLIDEIYGRTFHPFTTLPL
jgi:hypothetical protein